MEPAVAPRSIGSELSCAVAPPPPPARVGDLFGAMGYFPLALAPNTRVLELELGII